MSALTDLLDAGAMVTMESNPHPAEDGGKYFISIDAPPHDLMECMTDDPEMAFTEALSKMI